MKTDKELEDLMKLKKQLINRSLELKEIFENQRATFNSPQKIINIDEKFFKEAIQINTLVQTDKFSAQLLDASKKSSGISYKNVSRRWVKDEIWHYKANVEMKIMNFAIDVTVNKHNKKNEILDINCHFVGVQLMYLEEISSWTQKMTRERNFSSLMSTFADFNDQAGFRLKTMKNLIKENYITIDDGVMKKISFYVHSPKNTKHYYAKFSWTLMLNHSTTFIEHTFKIEGLDYDFIDAHQGLIKRFCSALTKSSVRSQWEMLCAAIANYNNPSC